VKQQVLGRNGSPALASGAVAEGIDERCLEEKAA
jgi:hypothetical protein